MSVNFPSKDAVQQEQRGQVYEFNQNFVRSDLYITSAYLLEDGASEPLSADMITAVRSCFGDDVIADISARVSDRIVENPKRSLEVARAEIKSLKDEIVSLRANHEQSGNELLDRHDDLDTEEEII